MVSVAAGLALGGKTVFIYTIVPFATLRCYEQIKIDLCCMNLPVTIVGVGVGLTYGSDGTDTSWDTRYCCYAGAS